ncbi:uncharacterized protein DNG_06060 [Cephalotrichum gorgonifer]|uniref:Uncharacterized protein n=1 Tax=Cephalotrichum gorgonifer TaxID=2041049 RepID=A0AAE8SWV6_9PEZI|nr:uncharacterized protein DNG_06060 [Cephalotrichum gorgonifer]
MASARHKNAGALRDEPAASIDAAELQKKPIREKKQEKKQQQRNPRIWSGSHGIPSPTPITE